MRRAANFTILSACLSLGIQTLLNDHWWAALVCGLAGALWLAQSQESNVLGPAVSLLTLVGVCAAGIFWGHNRVWVFTNLVLTLAAWDLDAFAQDLAYYTCDPDSNDRQQTLILAHIKHLGLVLLVGWSLGVIALRIQIPLNFITAVILTALVVFSLRWVLRSLRPVNNQDKPG